MGHRNNPASLAKRDEEGRFAPQDSRGDYRRDMAPSYQTRRGHDESRFGRDDAYRSDPYMAAGNTYREPTDSLDDGSDDYPGQRGNHGNYGTSGAGRDDYERAQRSDWQRDADHRRMQQRHMPEQGRSHCSGRDDRYYAGDHHYPPSGPSMDSRHEPFDPDYHQWRTEQMNLLDNDYRSWREDRYKRFSEDFNTWRSKRKTAEASDTTHNVEGSADTGKHK